MNGLGFLTILHRASTERSLLRSDQARLNSGLACFTSCAVVTLLDSVGVQCFQMSLFM